MAKKKGSKAPKGRAGAKQKAKGKSPSAGWAENSVRSSHLTKQILDDDDGKAQISSLLSIAPSCC